MTLILLALGTNIAANNQHGLMMLYKAANAGHEGVVQLLLGEPGGHRGPGSGRAAWSSRSRGTKEVIKLWIETAPSRTVSVGDDGSPTATVEKGLVPR